MCCSNSVYDTPAYKRWRNPTGVVAKRPRTYTRVSGRWPLHGAHFECIFGSNIRNDARDAITRASCIRQAYNVRTTVLSIRRYQKWMPDNQDACLAKNYQYVQKFVTRITLANYFGGVSIITADCDIFWRTSSCRGETSGSRNTHR